MVNLRSEAEVRAAYGVASQFRGEVLVERHIEGDDYRLLIVNGKMVAAARRDPAQVTGDGRSTVAQLVEVANRDPGAVRATAAASRASGWTTPPRWYWASRGSRWSPCRPRARGVKLRQNCNLSTGGTSTDVTDRVHPANARLAELAAQMLNLDIAGIDMLCKDIRCPLSEQVGAIVEVNAASGLRMHRSRPAAFRATWAAPSSTCSTRRARPLASRSSR
jgi:cyanophycin synthetase